IALFNEIDKTFSPTRLHIFAQEAWTKNYVTLPNSNGERTTDLRFTADSGLVKMLTNLSSSIYFGEGQTYPISIQADKPRMALLGAQLFVAMPGSEALAGWIAVGSKAKGERYYTEDLNYLTELCKLTGREFERAQIQADKDRREHEMNVLTRVAQGVTVTVAFDDILELIYAQTGHLLPSGDFNISLYNADTKTLRHAFYIEQGERLSDNENRETSSNQGLESEVIRGRRAIISDDYLKACRDYGVVPTREGILSWMGVPLNAGAETIGVISIASRDPGVAYAEEQKNLLQAVADQAAGAIVKARLLEESERRARQLATLNEVARSLTSTLEIDPLLNGILQSATSILNCEAGSLLLVDQETDELVFEVTAGPVADDLTGTRLAQGVGLVGQSVDSRNPIIVNDVEQSNSWSDETDKETGFITRDLLVVPMMVKDNVIGVIEVINKRDRSPFSPEDQELLMAFTGQAAILVENARLYAQTDQRLASRVEELSVMQRIDRELNTSLDVERAMQITLDWSFQQSATSAGLVGLVGEEGLTIVASQGFTTELDQFEDDPIPLDFPSIRDAISSGQVQSLQSESLAEGSTLSAQTKSQLVIPIRRESDVIGLLILESTEESGFDEETQDFLVRLSNHAAIAISNAQLYSEVQKANLAKSEFVSFVAHELKTPMTSIKGYADLLAAGAVGEINDAQDNFLSTIRTNVTRMSTLVTDLADISRIEAGRLHLEFATIPVGEAVEDVVHSTRALIDEKRQILNIDIPDDLSPAWGDRNRIIQILTNLVSNAHKYTPEAGNIIIKAREADNEWEPEGAAKVVHISVSDSGIGIKDEDQKKIFQQYFRTEDSKDFAAGTGLGLNIARYLVEMQGGKIWFESEYRKGTTFHFTIPLTGIESV
ncbi:MAG: GAF domain-containing protein, partial [Chloroflexota bacterium]